MSDRDPEADWNQPRGDFSRGGGPGTPGARPGYGQMTPLAASSWERNRGWILGLAVGVVLLVAGLVVFLVLGS